MENVKSINELEIGDLVTDGNGTYARVKSCVHGNLYYGFIGDVTDCLRYEEYSSAQISMAAVVNDFYDNPIDCCA